MDATNLLRLIKLQNIFAPDPTQMGSDMPSQGGIMGNLPVGGGSDNMMLPPQQEAQQMPYGTPDPTQNVGSQQTPDIYQHQNIDQLNQLISDYPQEDKVSKWRRLGAVAIGMGYGPAAAQQFVHEPYQRKVADWKNKVQPTESAATQERLINRDIQQTKTQEDKQDLAERTLEYKKTKDEADRKIRADRAATYDFKTKHPNHIYKEDDKGRILAVDPQTNQTSILADENGEPIKSSILTDVDKANLQLTNQKELIAARGEEARKTEATRETNRQSDIAARGAQARTTQAAKPASTGAGAKPELPTQTKARQYNKAREAYNTHPEWQSFIKLGNPGTNDFEIVAPGTSLFGMRKTGPADAEFQKMKDFIYGTDQISPASSHQPPGFPATTTNAPKAPKGWKYVPKQGGGWTAVKDE